MRFDDKPGLLIVAATFAALLAILISLYLFGGSPLPE